MQEHVPHSSNLSSSPLSSNNTLTSGPAGLVSSALSELGLKDLRPAMMVAEQVDNDLAIAFKDAHAAFERTPNAITKKRVLSRLDGLEERLEEELDKAEELQKAAEKRLEEARKSEAEAAERVEKEAEAHVAETPDASSYVSYPFSALRSLADGFVSTIQSGLQTVHRTFQAAFDSDDASLVARYNATAERCRKDLATLSEYREALNVGSAEEAAAEEAKAHSAEEAKSSEPQVVSEPSVIEETESSASSSTQFACAMHRRFAAFELEEAEGPELFETVQTEEPIAAEELDEVEETPEEKDFSEASSPTTLPSHNTRRTLFDPPPPNTTAQFCYPLGNCSFPDLRTGNSGFLIQGEGLIDQAGHALVRVGNVNGNGADSFVWGAPDAAPLGRQNAGQAFLTLGSKQGRPWAPASSFSLDARTYTTSLRAQNLGVMFYGQNPGDQFGCSVATVGDMDGNGFPEILVAACNFSMPGAPSVGAAYLIWDSSAFGAVNAPSTYDISQMVGNGTAMAVHGANSNDHLGGTNSSSNALSRSGDITGDGRADVILPAAQEVDVLFGNPQRSAWTRTLTNISSYMDGTRGVRFTVDATEMVISASWIGDINGDGKGDFAILMSDKVCVVFGAAPGAWAAGSFNLSTFIDGVQGFCITFASASNPMQVTGGGDNNGDGIADFLVAGPSTSAYLFFGSRAPNAWGGIPSVSADTLTDGVRGARLDTQAAVVSVNNDGDLDGDGMSEVVLGMPDAQGSIGPEQGVVQVLLGSNQTADWMGGVIDMRTASDGKRAFSVAGESTHDHAGNAVDMADIDGDGYGDLLTGAPGISDLGQVHVIYGVLGNSTRFIENNLRFGLGQNIRVDDTMLAVESSVVSSPNVQLFSAPDRAAGFTGSGSFYQSGQFGFYQSEITSGKIAFYSSSGVVGLPQIRVFTCTTLLLQFYSDATIHLGFTPSVTSNSLNMLQGGSVVLDSTNLVASSRYDAPDDINLRFGDIAHIQFNEIDVNNQMVRANITQCTQRDIRESHIQAVHDGSLIPPHYYVIASDSQSFSGKEFVIATLNFAIQLRLNPMIFDEGQATPITLNEVSALQGGTLGESTQFQVANATFGYLAFAGNDAPITGFSQLALSIGNVGVVQNGTGVPDFLIRATDILGGSPTPWQSPNVTLNHRPVVKGNASDVKCVQNQPCDVEVDVNFTDPDGDPLTYSAQLAGGAPLPPTEVTYHPPNRFSAKLSTLTPLQIEIQARDPRNLVTSKTFVLSSYALVAAQKGFDLQKLRDYGSPAFSAFVLLAGWAIYRRHRARLRRRCELARLMRKIGNLEYHDFDQGGGDIFKRKVEAFIDYLNEYHDNFYNKLGNAEEESFAMCVMGILQKRGLIHPSGKFNGTWGWIRCYTEGWSSEIELTEFRKQKVDIAAQAVARWKAQANPTEHWNYNRRSRVGKLKACFFCCVESPYKARLARLAQEQEVEPAEAKQQASSPRHQPKAGLFGREASGNKEERLAQLKQQKKAMKKEMQAVETELAELMELEAQGPEDSSSKQRSSSRHKSKSDAGVFGEQDRVRRKEQRMEQEQEEVRKPKKKKSARVAEEDESVDLERQGPALFENAAM